MHVGLHKTEYLVMAHGREDRVQKARRSLVTSGGVHGFKPPLQRTAQQEMAQQLPLPLVRHRVRGSPQRVPTPSSVDDARSPISLQGSAHKSRPGLFSIQGPSRGPSSTGGSTNVSSREVSKDRQTLRRMLTGLPASKPDSRFVPSVESPTCSSVQRLSPAFQHGASFVRSF